VLLCILLSNILFLLLNSRIKYPLTSLLISLNTSIYLVFSIPEAFVQLPDYVILSFGVSYWNLLNGKIWTLISSIFLHANPIHLLLNMAALYLLGRAIEYDLGIKHAILIYFSSGILSSLLSIFPPGVIGVGASGAIFGLLGCRLSHYLKLKTLSLWDISATILLALGIGFSNVSVLAHFSGLLTGLAIGYFIPPKE